MGHLPVGHRPQATVITSPIRVTLSSGASRAEPRDYIDTAAALEHYTVEAVIAFARRLDPGLEERDFADAGRRLDRWGDVIFAPFGLEPADVAALRVAFAGWPR